MIVGYARIGSVGEAAQLKPHVDQLMDFGAQRVVEERANLTDAILLQAAIDGLAQGDDLAVVHLSAVVTSAQDLLDLLAQLREKGASLQVLSIGLAFGNRPGPMIDGLLRALVRAEKAAQEEARELASLANQDKPARGRKASARALAAEVIELANQDITRQEIADRLGIGVASVYRILRSAKKGTAQGL